MVTFQFAFQMPIAFKTFRKMMNSKARNFFPDIDEDDDLKQAYQTIKDDYYNYITLKPTLKFNKRNFQNWQYALIIGKAMKSKDKEHSQELLKQVLIHSGVFRGAGTYFLFANKGHPVYKHQVKKCLEKLEITKDDAYAKKRISTPAQYRHYQTLRSLPREKTIRDVFEGDKEW